jgi:hypothetical protein
MIEEQLGNRTVAYDLVWTDWIAWFNGTYRIADFDGKFSFKAIAKSSFEYVKGSIKEMSDSMIRAEDDRAAATMHASEAVRHADRVSSLPCRSSC